MNMKIAIVTDSACDIPDAVLAAYGIRMISLRIVYHRGEYRDRVDITPDAVYGKLEEEVPKTSLPLPEDVTRLYDTLLAEGVTHVAHFCISSGLSGTYNMVRIIASEYEDRMTMRVLDTKSLSMQEGMIVLACVQGLAQGKPFDKAIDDAMALRGKSIGMFVIRTLEYLRKGGRIGLVEGVLGTMLQLKPVIFVNDDGIYQTHTKARGYPHAIEAMLRNVSQLFGQKRVKVAIVHGAAQQEAEKLLVKAQALFNIVEHTLVQVSPVLGVHTGPGLVGIIACEA